MHPSSRHTAHAREAPFHRPIDRSIDRSNRSMRWMVLFLPFVSSRSIESIDGSRPLHDPLVDDVSPRARSPMPSRLREGREKDHPPPPVVTRPRVPPFVCSLGVPFPTAIGGRSRRVSRSTRDSSRDSSRRDSSTRARGRRSRASARARDDGFHSTPPCRLRATTRVEFASTTIVARARERRRR